MRDSHLFLAEPLTCFSRWDGAQFGLACARAWYDLAHADSDRRFATAQPFIQGTYHCHICTGRQFLQAGAPSVRRPSPQRARPDR